MTCDFKGQKLNCLDYKLIGPGNCDLPKWNNTKSRFTFNGNHDYWEEINENGKIIWNREISPTYLYNDKQWSYLLI